MVDFIGGCTLTPATGVPKAPHAILLAGSRSSQRCFGRHRLFEGKPPPGFTHMRLGVQSLVITQREPGLSMPRMEHNIEDSLLHLSQTTVQCAPQHRTAAVASAPPQWTEQTCGSTVTPDMMMYLPSSLQHTRRRSTCLVFPQFTGTCQ